MDRTVTIRSPGGAEITWRTQRMGRLGADAELAAKIAHSDADVHDIERLLKAGCTLEQRGSFGPSTCRRRSRVRSTTPPASFHHEENNP